MFIRTVCLYDNIGLIYWFARSSLTGHVEISSEEPTDLPSVKVAVLDPVERLHPAESVCCGGSPEPIRIRD